MTNCERCGGAGVVYAPGSGRGAGQTVGMDGARTCAACHPLRPFFCYYGGKWRAAPHYPPPQHDTIIEPFAGAAGYATRYADRNVILIEKNPVVAGLWSWLTRASAEEILALPLLGEGQTTDDLRCIPEAKALIGFWINKGNVMPRKRPSAWARTGDSPRSWWGSEKRAEIATQIDRVRHWRVICGTYTDAPDIAATWFVDPPYNNKAGSYYKMGPGGIDYAHLAVWCQLRRGQVLVCENAGASWLPFAPFRRIKAAPGKHKSSNFSEEVLWQGGCA